MGVHPHTFTPESGFQAMAKRKSYKGRLEVVPSDQILLNISKLKDGTYILKIMDENKMIKETTFIKMKAKGKQ